MTRSKWALVAAGFAAVVVLGASCGKPQRKPLDTKVDCTDKKNCYRTACYDTPECASVPAPGGCGAGQVKGITLTASGDFGDGECHACTAEDCDGLGGYCCNADVCQDSVACGVHYCDAIAASCADKSSDYCGFKDLDDDDPWGDVDEQVDDPCCYCKQAVGFDKARCGFGQYVLDNKCTQCGSDTCSELPCMGLNGCPTNCDAGMFFNGVRCMSCDANSQKDFIPACKK